MEGRMRLEEFSTKINACMSSSTACGLCRNQCPSLEFWGREARTPRGRMALCAHLLRGNLFPSPSLMEAMFSCILCGNCDAICPVGAGPSRVVEAARERLVERGFLPSKHEERGSHVGREHNPYLESHAKRFSWLPGLNLPERAPLVYFVGCTSSYREKELARKVVELLGKMGLNFTLLKDEWCCGSFLLRTGQGRIDGRKVEEMARHNLEEVRKRVAKEIVVNCPGCYRAWKSDYPELGIQPEVEVLHLVQLLEREKNRLKVREEEVRVTYHDPCHLGRHMGIYEEPRRVLSSLPGVELVEMPRNRENSWCCGSGGGFRAGYPEASKWVARKRLEEARETGAQFLLTACPFCLRQLKEVAETLRYNMKVMDLTEFLLERWGGWSSGSSGDA
ncbi:MAG: (Fe-S)-binding protein [Candidatus Hadarchaeales archaeon]